MSPAERAAALPSDAVPVAAPARRSRPGMPRLRVAAASSGRSAASVIGTVALGLLFLSVLGVVVFQALLVQTQSHLDDLEEQVRVEEARADDLRLRLAELQSPARIVAEARERLGMIPPDEVLYLQNDPADDAAATLDPAELTPSTTVPTAGGTAAATTTGPDADAGASAGGGAG